MRKIKILRSDDVENEEIIYNVNDFPYSFLSDVKTVKSRQGYKILNIPCAFDIETTTIVRGDKKEGFMYIWQFCIDTYVCMGRTWEEYKEFIGRLEKEMKNKRLVVYVHNLAFEFQFMRDFFEWENIFAKEKRKVLKCLAGNIEYRCSYYLTNMSLEKACENANALYYKRSGEDFDYSKIRTAETELTEQELTYCYCDVRGLCEVIADKLKEDTLDTIPLTSTGYVRRDCRNAMRKNPENRKQFKKCAVTKEVYQLLEEAKRGGNTHGNRRYAGEILKDVKCFDVASSYPFQMMCQYYPVTPFILLSRNVSRETFYKAIGKYCCLFRVAFSELTVKDNVPVPYIAYHKLKKHHEKDIVFNGRLLYSKACLLTLTEIDFEIIQSQYTWESWGVSDFYIAERGELCKELKDQIIHYFENKTKLKGVDDYNYMKSKNLLNSIFGMMCTNPVHDEITLTDDGWTCEKGDIDTELKKYYRGRNNFLSIQNGVWVTAHARKWLQNIIDVTGNNTVYCDTDSDKCIDIDREKLAELNQKAIYLAEKNHAYCDKDGKRYYMGVYEEEDTCDFFRTWGAKKYAYCIHGKKRQLKITIAGVHKSKGAKYLKSIGGLKKFKTGLVFNGQKNGGGTESHWNDDGIHYITVNGCTMLTGANVGILESSYTLGVTGEFLENMDFAIDELEF